MRTLFSKIFRKALRFCAADHGNVTVTFAVLLVPMLGAIGGAVDYSNANSVKSAMQAALDAAALSTIKAASTLSNADLQTTAANYFNATYNRPDARNVNVTAAYDSSTSILTLAGSTSVNTSFMRVLGFNQLNIGDTSKATIGKKKWQICVLVTDPDSNHTLLVKGNSTINFDNCMVQVNTKNWDAVEARDTSYIHSTNGDNCFVGDIHYGDVQPPKDPTCEFFDDPFAGYVMPASAAHCDNAGIVSLTPITLSPGTYCGNIDVSADTVFQKGVYILVNGKLHIGSKANVTGDGVTFLFTGNKVFDSGDFNIQIQTTGTINLTPASDADAGIFGGFVFFIDQGTGGRNKKQGKVRIWNTTMKTSGVLYLRGAVMDIERDSNASSDPVLTVNPGSIIADMILPDKGGTMNLTGTLNASSAALKKLIKSNQTSGTPILVQ